jgi:hypothetical protein
MASEENNGRFRRGLATNLRMLGVDDLTIMEILRHNEVEVTRRNYIKRVSAKSVEAMDRLEAKLRKPVTAPAKRVLKKAKRLKSDPVAPVGIAKGI